MRARRVLFGSWPGQVHLSLPSPAGASAMYSSESAGSRVLATKQGLSWDFRRQRFTPKTLIVSPSVRGAFQRKCMVVSLGMASPSTALSVKVRLTPDGFGGSGTGVAVGLRVAVGSGVPGGAVADGRVCPTLADGASDAAAGPGLTEPDAGEQPHSTTDTMMPITARDLIPYSR